jgi:hypothetical protein
MGAEGMNRRTKPWRLGLAMLLLAGGCFAQKHDEPGGQGPQAKPSAPAVGVVPFSDISGHQAGPAVTAILEARLGRQLTVKRLPGEGFLAGNALLQAFQLTAGRPVVMGRVSAYEFQQQRSRRLGPPDYDLVQARAVVSLSLRVLTAGGEVDGGTLVWSRSLTGEDQGQWADNYRTEMGANPLYDAYATPSGLAPVRLPGSMLNAATERAIEACMPDVLNAVAPRGSVVSAL